MDSNHDDEVRQQRLSLTWHGANEGGSYKELAGEAEPKAERKPKSGGLKILKRPAIIALEESVDPVESMPVEEEEAAVAEPREVLGAELPDAIFATAAEELAADLHETAKDPVEEETVVVKAPEPAEVTPDELDAILDEELDEVLSEDPDKRVTVVADTPAIADVPVVAEMAGDETTEQCLEDITATAILTVDGDLQDDPVIEEEITCSQMLRSGVTNVVDMNSDDLDQDEGATATIPAITPAEVNEEFTTEREPMPEEKPARKVVLSKTPVEQNPDRPKPALTVDKDDVDMTSRLKVRRTPAIKTVNTCKMRPDTQELVGGAALGEKLRIAREASQMDLFEVAEKTRISSEYISALEEERFEGLPLAAIYIKSYLKTLARCYGIDSDELIAEYEERTSLERPNGERARSRTTTADSGQKESDGTSARWISWAIGAVAAIVIVVLVAGVLIHNRVGSLSDEDLAIVSDSDLREMITQEFLPYRERPVPTNETAAVGR